MSEATPSATELPDAKDAGQVEATNQIGAFMQEFNQALKEGSTTGYFRKDFGLDAKEATDLAAKVKPLLEAKGYRVFTICWHEDDFWFGYNIIVSWTEEAYTKFTTSPPKSVVDGPKGWVAAAVIVAVISFWVYWLAQ